MLKEVILPKKSATQPLLGVSRHMGEETGTLALSPEALLVKCPWKSHETTQSKWLKWFLVRVRATLNVDYSIFKAPVFLISL